MCFCLYCSQYLHAQYLIRKLKKTNSYFSGSYLSGLSKEADALIEIGKPSINPLIKVLKNDRDDKLRGESLLILTEIYKKTKDDRIVIAHTDALKDRNVDIRREAAKALGELRNPLVANSLKYSFEHDPDDVVRKFALDSLTEIDYPGLVAFLSSSLDDERYILVKISYLGDTRDPQAVEPLLKKIKDRNHFVRFEAVVALGKIGDSRAVGSLIKTLKDEDSSVRWESAAALGNIRDQRAVGALVDALKDDEPDVRMNSAVALGKIGDEKAIEPLKRLLRDPESCIRDAASKSIKEIQGKIQQKSSKSHSLFGVLLLSQLSCEFIFLSQ